MGYILINNHAYIKLYYHLVWSTKNRTLIIKDEFKNDLYNYIGKIIVAKGFHLIAIGGVQDHIHLLIQTSPTKNISDIVCKIKSNSSRFVKENFLSSFAWQEGYAAFTIDETSILRIKNYIENQEEHHKLSD